MPLIKLRGWVSDRIDLLPHAIVLVFFLGVVVVTHSEHFPWIDEITQNYLPVHIALELVGILISFGVFTVGWATYQNVRSTDILVLSVASFAVGWLDLGHTLSFTGMPDFITPSSPDKSINFWLASRLTGAVGFLFVSLRSPSEFKSWWIRWALLATAIIWCFVVFSVVLLREAQLPDMFIPGVGLTKIKMVLEWVTIILSMISGFFFFRQSVRHNLLSMQWMGCATLLFAMSGFFFTMYREYDDLYNFIGHVYKAVGFMLVYRAVFTECIKLPYEEAKRSAQEALDANSSKSRFLANVSHEFRTPLGVILGFSDLLLESRSLDKEERTWAETISRNARQFRVLIDDLLDLAKAENENIRIQVTKFDAVKVIGEVVSGLQLQAEAKGIQLSFKSQFTDKTFVHSDENRFRQILLNVIGNAVKFTSRGGVHVSARNREMNRIEIRIEDSGIGISANNIERLFQPFAQVDDPRSRRFGGTGLGLALSKKLCDLLGGDLWIERSEPGVGSTFTFTIADQHSEPTADVKIASPEKITTSLDLSGLHILAAEDSIDNRVLLELYLKPTAARVTFATNGREAVQLSKEHAFDLILMDIQMPEMDGYEAVTLLRADGWQGPILALSAHAHPPERERARKGGFTDYLVKPISRTKLWEALAEYSKTDP